MSLSLIVGPPNSGRAGVVRERLIGALERDPVLVVPTLEDAARFERELCERAPGGAVLGASILTFERLFDEVARATGGGGRPRLSRSQRLHLVRRAIANTDLRTLARSARRSGFAAELASLIEEIESSCIDPDTAGEHAAASAQRPYLEELGSLYGAYVALREQLDLSDSHVTAAEATAALRSHPDSWGARPVALYGFDDMTVEQLELVDALARATDVWATVTFEDRAALRARASLREELRERGGEVIVTAGPDKANTHSEILFHLERGFLTDGHPRASPDPGLVLMEAAGERGQAEQIGGEIARLVADGEPPDEIAVVVRYPDRDGPLYEEVLAGLGIPAAVEARVPVERTAVGRGLAALLRAAFGPRRAEDALAFLRTPGRGRPRDVDWLERAIRRLRLVSAGEAFETWRGRALFELDDLREAVDAPQLLRAVARLARLFAQYPYERAAPRPEREHRLELRAGSAAAEALEELAEIAGIEDGPAEALACLEALDVPLWRGPSDGHVRVTSPYRIRARRVRHLFVASLQEGEFPRRDPGEPLLSDEGRSDLGLPPRASLDDEERYLFYVCLSRPTERLHLCWRSCDDEGISAAPSPLLDDVRDLLAPAPPSGDAPDPLDARIRRRSLAEVTVDPSAAASANELARALAARGRRDRVEIPAGLEIPGALAESLRMRLEQAAERSAFLPGPIRTPAVLDALERRQLFGASTLEAYALCSYRWFVQHELVPEALDPDPDPLVHGSIVHRVLEELYRDPPGPQGRPRVESLEAWRRRAGELTARIAAERRLGGADAGAIASRARIEALVVGFVEREADSESRLRPDPALLEARFGDGDDDPMPPLDLGGFGLHGMIDRVDVAPGGGAGLIRDYKASREVTPASKLAEDGKLQLQLYAHALSRHWGIRPLGGVYEPLAATRDARPRGILRAAERDGPLAGLDLVGPDLLDEDEFDAALTDAAGRAAAIVADMRAGRIDRDPIDDRCPRFCTFQAICRRERAAARDPDPADEDEESRA